MVSRRREPRTDWEGWEPPPRRRLPREVVRAAIRAGAALALRVARSIGWLLKTFGTLVAIALAAAAVIGQAGTVDRLEDQQRALKDVVAQLQTERGRNTDTIRRLAEVVRQIQVERRRNTLLSCQSEKRQNRAIRTFVTNTIPPDRRRDPDVLAFLASAARTFPDRDCKAEVRDRVQGAAP